jgi:hypothetical protein
MADTPYTGKLNQSYLSVQTLEETLRSITDHKSASYKAILAQLVAANKEYTDLQKQEQDWQKSQGKKKDLTAADSLQRELDIASASKDTAKIKDLAGKIVKLGGTPTDAITGKPIDPKTGLIATAVVTPTTDKGAKTGGLPIPAGAKVSGTNIVDAKGNILGTVLADGKSYKPSIVTQTVTSGTSTSGTTSGTASTGGSYTATTGTKYLADPASTFKNYLVQAFSTINDPKSKAMIDKLFKDATTFKYTDAEFLAKLNDIPWWQSQSPSMQDFVLKSNDPRYKGTLEAQIANKADAVSTLMGSLGLNIMDIDPITGQKVDRTGILHGLAVQAVQNNWSTAQIQEHIASNNATIFTRGGTIGSQLDAVKNQALLYGVTIDSGYEKIIAHDLMDPTSGRDANYYKYQFQQQAMNGTWAPFAQAIKDGQNLYSITNTYRDSMSKLLEVDPSQITWNDLEKGIINPETGKARTMFDFTTQVKNNPLWQYTANAKDTYTSLGEDLMKEFGFIG